MKRKISYYLSIMMIICCIGCSNNKTANEDDKPTAASNQGVSVVNTENVTEAKSEEYIMHTLSYQILADAPAKYTYYEEGSSDTFYGGDYLGSRYIAFTRKDVGAENYYKAYYKKGDNEVVSVKNIKESTFVNLHNEIEILDTNLKEEEVTVNGIKALRYEGTATNTKYAKDKGAWDVYVVGYSFEMPDKYNRKVIDIQGMVIDREQSEADKEEIKKYVEHAMQTVRSKP